MFQRLTRTGAAWADGTEEEADVVLWCTGFRPDLAHLAPLGLRGSDGHIPTAGTVPLPSRACTCWATATGLGRPRRP